MTHVLKCWPAEFDAMASGAKTFEYRKNDRGFSCGDTLQLCRWEPAEMRDTGERLLFNITYILHGGIFGVPEGFAVLGLARC